ncbi:N-acetyltransferase [Thalassovita sp.]|uniref:GNAT family N-acetyltransferase n=1 Tax=Thalassovita sp. TaxID=1979401 RepID=UPI002881A685|nr:N-acetyltransferase [Thalassovita sp.]MDF1804507.1 N-acetyltransferase [Thalassovita sp.]
MQIHSTSDQALPGLMTLYSSAFDDEDLRGLVSELVGRKDVLNLCAGPEDAPLGHVGFSLGQAGGQPVALLGPLAVMPSYQKQGIGSALIHAGLDQLRTQGVAQVLVLGDPAYYSRSGFGTERAVTPPYRLPAHWAEAWQSQMLNDGPAPSGMLEVPEPWMQAALWGE